MSATSRQTLSPKELAALRRYDAPTIANGIETFDVRPWTEGFMSPSIRCVFPEMGVMTGYAVTGKIRAAQKGAGSYSRHGWWDAILAVPHPRVIVLEDLDDPPVGAFWGEVQTNVHKALGCIGTVTDGSVRDIDQMAPGFFVLAGSIMPSHAHVHLADFGGTVSVAGMIVSSNDLIHADRHGAVVVPHAVVTRIPEAATLIARREKVLLDAAKQSGSGMAQLRAAFARSEGI